MIRKSALGFVLCMGIVSLFSDMTHEGARSIYGVYLNFMGMSAVSIGFIMGLGEFIGYSFRMVTGFIANRYKNYWFMNILGYIINMAAIPLLGFVSQDGWFIACCLIVLERMGKAIRQPAKNTLISFAATSIGAGKVFAIQEFLDQLGAFLGPVILFIVLNYKNGIVDFNQYSNCFFLLGIPASLTILFLLFAKYKFPHPEHFEDASEQAEFKSTDSFRWYIVSIGFLAIGFIDFPLVTMHVAKMGILDSANLSLIYAWAMLVDAFAALVFGSLYDRMGIKVLFLANFLSAFFAVFIFEWNSLSALLVGVTLWGIGMGSQESILKSVVASLIPKDKRSTAFGVFEAVFGLFWFLGSWFLGYLYTVDLSWMVIVSVLAQLLSIPFIYKVMKTKMT